MKKHFITLFLLSFTFGVFAQKGNDEKGNSAAFELSKNLTIYHNVLKEINLLYVDSVKNDKLIKKGIESMLSELDPYTIYMTEDDATDFKRQTTGEYGGIGTIVGKRGDYVIISQVYEGLAADKAGVKTGDKVIEIDGTPIKGLSLEKVTDMMKGRAGTVLNMKVERPYVSDSIKDLHIKRAKIQLDCVPYSTILDKNVGYLCFTSFTNKSTKRVKETIQKLKKEGATSLIIDLRGNLGGLLDQVVQIVNFFVPKKEIVVTTKSRIKEWDRSYQTAKKPLDTKIPIVILINGASASASEILAGALQDLDRAVIMGTHSFGKGLVQTTRDVGYNSRLKVTTAKYYIPSGRCVQALDYTHRNEDGSVGYIPDSLISEFKTRNGRKVYDGGGIMPDIEVKRDALSDLTFQLVREYQIFDFANWYANTHTPKSSVFKSTSDEYQKFIDFVDTAKFKYKSSSYAAFEDLKKALKKEKRAELPLLKQMEKELKPNLKQDLVTFQKQIQDLIDYQINIRYFYQKGGYEQSVRSDDLIEKAVKLLHNSKKYQGILTGKILADSSKKREKTERNSGR